MSQTLGTGNHFQRYCAQNACCVNRPYVSLDALPRSPAGTAVFILMFDKICHSLSSSSTKCPAKLYRCSQALSFVFPMILVKNDNKLNFKIN